jgi:hypothetical protein
MVRLSGRLSTLKVTHAREPGMLADGDGLYLQVSRAKARSWIFRYFRHGKSHEMGLGSLKAVGLAAARLKAAECRGLLAEGIDPIAARDAERAQRAVEDACTITFDHCADAFIKAHSSAWKNQKHVAQWTATIRTYVSPVFGSLPVQAVDVALVMNVLEPIWTTKPQHEFGEELSQFSIGRRRAAIGPAKIQRCGKVISIICSRPAARL